MELGFDLTATCATNFSNHVVMIGGTFDAMHQGHKDYIKLGFEFGCKVFIVLTSDDYAQKCKQYPVKPYEKRKSSLEFFIKEQDFKKPSKIIKMKSETDLFSICQVNSVTLAIVIPEYYSLVENINNFREKNKLAPLLILVKPRTKTCDGRDLNSTELNGFSKITDFSERRIAIPSYN